MAEPANVTVDVYVRDITVKDDSDKGPGGGEFDVTVVAAATPLAAEGGRSGVQWIGSVREGQTYAVGRWTGPVTLSARHCACTWWGPGRSRTVSATTPSGGAWPS